MYLTLLSILPPTDSQWIGHLIPYAILVLNCVLFKLLRSLFHGLIKGQDQSKPSGKYLIRLFINELISTCELCADCAELNVVYGKHGSLAYGLSLFVLTYMWIDAFGEAHTTPGYLVEDYVFIQGNGLLKSGSTYARFVGQSLAMPLAWRLASFYWKYKLLEEHNQYLVVENCKSSLSTATINGFLIEFTCCLLCRLIELIGLKLLENNKIGQRLCSGINSFCATLLVVMALELSGGYFNPILASSLEFGCHGISRYQHALVFWFGPLLGHVVARGIYRRYVEQVSSSKGMSSRGKEKKTADETKRITRSSSQRKKKRHND